MSNRSIRSYREASRYSGVPMTSLRDAIARGDVPQPVIGADGKATFDVAALDALRAVRTGPSAGAGSAPTTTPGAALTTEDEVTSFPIASTPVPTGSIADWMSDAAEQRDHAAGRDVQDSDEVDADAEAQAREPYLGIPLGATRSATPTLAWPYTAVIAGTNSPQIVALEQQLAEVSAQRDSMRNAWREQRIVAIANAEALVATSSGADPETAAVLKDAVAHALRSLDDVALADDYRAMGVARTAGIAAASWWVAERLRREQDGVVGDHDLARARARRSRSRSPRW